MKHLLILFCITVMPGCQFIQGILEPAAAKYRIQAKSDGEVKFGIAGTKFIGVETTGLASVFIKEKDGKDVFFVNVDEGTQKAWERKTWTDADGKKRRFKEITWVDFLAEWSPLPW